MPQTPVNRRAELLIVIAVIAALAANAIPRFLRARRAARERECRANIERIEKAVDVHQLAHDESMPSSLGALFGADGVEELMPACPLKGRYTLNDDGRVSCDHPHAGR